MTTTQFYKGTPFKAGTHKNTTPVLFLQITEVLEERKQIKVVTKGDTELILCFDGKREAFILRKYGILGDISGEVYNGWSMNEENTKTMLSAQGRW